MIKNLQITLLTLILAVNISTAQETVTVAPPSNDSLNKSIQSVLKEITSMKNLKITGWVQAQYQFADTTGAKNFDGGDFTTNSDSRFMIRRGRVKFTYNQKNSQYVMQINGSERGVSLVEIFGKYTDPWTHAFSITAGVFNRPFGYEIQNSSADRESPERSRWVQNFLPNERDIGAMLTYQPKGKLLHGLKIDAGFFNGTGIAVPGTGIPAGSTAASGITGVNGLTDFDRYKDFMGHLVYYGETKDKNIKYGIGVSDYTGGFMYQNNKVYSTVKTDTNGYKVWVASDTTNRIYKGTIAPRQYMGVEALFCIKSILGTTTIRGEYFTGTQTARDVDTKSPVSLPSSSGAMYVRSFEGAYAYFIHRIAKSKHEVVVKYEWIDPNTKVSASDLNGKNGMKEGEIKYTMLGLGYNFYLDQNVKFMLYYNMVTNETTQIAGYTRDLKDNILTIRMQYRF